MESLSRVPSGFLGKLDNGVLFVGGNAGAATLLVIRVSIIVGSAGLAAATADLGMVGNAVPDEPAGSSAWGNGGGGGNPPK